ncbi:MAG: thiamine pyrophosphokinase, partial [Mycobacteriales bacterium]
GAAEALVGLKRYLRRRTPVLIGVEGGAELLLDRGLTPDLVVGDATALSPRALAKAREVVVRGHVPQAVTERGIPVATYATSAASEDFALLLADQAGARTLVLVGYPGTTEQLLDRGRAGAPSALLVRMGLLDRVVGARVAAALTPRRSLVVPGLLVIVGLLSGQIAIDHWAW